MMLILKKLHNFFLFLLLLPSVATAQETLIRGFVDTQFGKIMSDTLKKSSGGFQVGQFDLYITSQINDRVSFLGETVFEWDQKKNNWSLDVERVIVKYSFKDYFNISSGKFHTPFGYWNNAYHHGALIQPTINRPVIVRFEDNGGYLPIHQIGLQVSGTGITSRNLGYALFISNGQAQGNTGGSLGYNSNAMSGSVSMEPVENLQLFLSAYSTTVPSGSFTYQGIRLTQDSHYTMYNAAISYFGYGSPIEFAAEYFNISNRMTSSHSSRAMYCYVGFPTKKKITPYVLYNKITFQSGEKYFINNDVDEITCGTRFLLGPKTIWKMEYTFNQSELYKNSFLIQTQLAVGF